MRQLAQCRYAIGRAGIQCRTSLRLLLYLQRTALQIDEHQKGCYQRRLSQPYRRHSRHGAIPEQGRLGGGRILRRSCFVARHNALAARQTHIGYGVASRLVHQYVVRQMAQDRQYTGILYIWRCQRVGGTRAGRARQIACRLLLRHRQCQIRRVALSSQRQSHMGKHYGRYTLAAQ